MRAFKLIVAYDGTDFAGWQRQAADRTVQAVIEDALAPIEGAPVTIAGAGRTDAGVHAAGQVVSVSLGCRLTPVELARALNATLPADVRVLDAVEAPAGFHARFAARAKTYQYWIAPGVVPPPALRHVVWHVPQALDVVAMGEAAAALVGTHDFAAFQSAGSDVTTTTRTIDASRVEPRDLTIPGATARLLCYDVTGSGFLRHMVRAIAGTLVDVGRGRRPASDMARVLAARDRGAASATAPAHGLTLVRVDYD